MSLSKEFLLRTYKAVKEAMGRQPSAKEFRKKTAISYYALQSAFGRNWWNKLVKAAGGKPITFSRKRITNEELLTNWGRFVRKINRVPCQVDWLFYKYKPAAITYCKRFGSLFNIQEEFRKFAFGKRKWKDVIALLPAEEHENFNKKDEREENYRDYIPSLLNDFERLSKSESEGFENSVALIYQFLGFDVEKLGKEKTGKREPDGIAYNKGSYAIIYDSKSRKGGYCIRTDDRQVIEYIKKYRDKIHREGCGKIYYQIISSRFGGNPSKAVKNIKKETQVQLTLIKADDLLKLLSKKIEHPLKFTLSNFESLLIENGVINAEKVDRFLGEID